MAKERLIKSTSATSDSQGRATFTLGPAELGYVYEGSVQVPSAPAGALFTATVLTTNWGQWAGPTNYGPIQLYGGEYLTVNAVGLNPNTAYVLTIFGVWGPQEEFEPVPPGAPMSVVSVETATLLVSNKVFTAPAQNVTFRPPSLTRRLTILCGAGIVSTAFLTLTGDQTGAVYFTNATTISSTNNIFFVAIEPTIDQTYTLTFQGTGALNGGVYVLASFSNPLVEGIGPGGAVPVVGPSISGTTPINVSGSPVGTFNNQGAGSFAAGANQVLITSPGAGQSIYLQTLTVANAAGSRSVFHNSNGGNSSTFAELGTTAVNTSSSITFPGGYRLPANTSLQVDVTGATTDILFTYTTGPTV